MSNSVAKALLEIGAIGFSLEKPITFKSGIVSPVYIDNRRLPFFPREWAIVFEGFRKLISDDGITFDCIAGVETAGIPHSATLGFLLQKPSVFVRKTAKDHGTKKMIEGGEVKGKKVLLVEDHVTTGVSSLTAVEHLRSAGAIVEVCLSITSYQFKEAQRAFSQKKVMLHTLISFAEIFSEALALRKLAQAEVDVVKDWLADPKGWAIKNNTLSEA